MYIFKELFGFMNIFRIFTGVFCLLGGIIGSAQTERILLDGYFQDWEQTGTAFSDTKNDGKFGFDYNQLKIFNDDNYLYINFDLGLEINLQETNDVVFCLDADNNPATGYVFDGIGAELIFRFGERKGTFYRNTNTYNVKHSDIGLVTLPSVSSDRFELCIRKNASVSGFQLFSGNSMRMILLQDVPNGDKFPDGTGGITYTWQQNQLEPLPVYSIKRATDTDFRIMTQNVLTDDLFSKTSYFNRLINAIQPDIIAFQEIYDHTAAQTRELIQQFTGGTWYAQKQGTDIILVSRYPILESHFISGNGAFLVQTNEGRILVVNAHLPCCDNDSGRQDEVDAIMAFIRDAKKGNSSLQLDPNTPIIITGDMNFVGKSRQLRTYLEGDIQNEFTYGTDYKPDWDNTSLKDAVLYTTASPLAVTWSSSGSSYFPGRLDYIIYTDAVLNRLNGFALQTANLPQDSLNAYLVLANDSNNASDHFAVVADFKFGPETGTSEPSEMASLNARLIPAAFSEQMKIAISSRLTGKINVSIFQINGQMVFSNDTDVYSGENQLMTLDTHGWPTGMYLVQIRQHHEMISLKAVKVE